MTVSFCSAKENSGLTLGKHEAILLIKRTESLTFRRLPGEKALTQGPVMGFMLRFAVPLGNSGGAGDHDWNPSYIFRKNPLLSWKNQANNRI